MKRVIMLSGPPESGKDRFFKTCQSTSPIFVRVSFADEVKRRTHAALGIDSSYYDYFEKNKDEPHHLFFGKTPRQAYIAFSENFMKPFAGKNIWGRLVYAQVKEHLDNGKIVVITDLGFREEGEYLLEMGIDPNEIAIVHLRRRGKNFSNDSRRYVWLQYVQHYNMESDNNFDNNILAFLENVCYDDSNNNCKESMKWLYMSTENE